MHLLLATGCFLLAFQGSTVRDRHAAQDPRTPDGPLRPGSTTELLVSGFNSDKIHVFRAENGNVHGTVLGVPGAQSMVMHAGLLYACAEKIDRVLCIDPETRDVI